MASLDFAYDHSRDPMSPAQLGSQIATSLSLAVDPIVDIDPAKITVTHPNIGVPDRPAIQSLINAYVYDPSWSGGVAGKIKASAEAALGANKTYLAIASPTNPQVVAQVRALTRQANGLIRLAIGDFDSSADT